MQEPSPTVTFPIPPLPPSVTTPPQTVTAGGHVALLLAYAGFIGLGLVSSRTGVTWPAIRTTFGMPIDAISMLLMAHLIGSIVVSASSGRLTARLNIGILAAWSCGAIALALLVSGVTTSWVLLVALSVLTGFGAGALEASLNTYAAMHFSPRAMNWLHASFGVGATLGPALMTVLLVSNLGWRIGFLAIGVIELILGIGFITTRHTWLPALPTSGGSLPAGRVALSATLRLPVTWLGILLFIAFCGVQASAGQWFFSVLTDERGLSDALAGTWISLLWASLTAGRVVVGFVLLRFTSMQVLRACMGGVLLSTLLFWLNLTPWLGFVSIMLLGLALAPLFPLLTMATPRYLGRQHAANGIGLQVAAAGLGSVLITSLVGVLARTLGLWIIAPTVVAIAVAAVVLYELLVRTITSSEA